MRRQPFEVDAAETGEVPVQDIRHQDLYSLSRPTYRLYVLMWCMFFCTDGNEGSCGFRSSSKTAKSGNIHKGWGGSDLCAGLPPTMQSAENWELVYWFLNKPARLS